MVSFVFALILAIEAALCVFAGCVLWGIPVAGYPIGAAVVVLAGMVFLGRIVMVLLEFGGAYYWRARQGPDVRIGVYGALRLVVLEIAAVFLMFGVLLPFTKKLIARRRGMVSTQAHLPVIFIHGYMSRRGVFAPLLRYLESRGLSNLFTMHFHPRHGEMDYFARQLAEYVERVCNMTRCQKVILVGYSMGGLIARAYVERWGGAHKAAKVITIGTPHHGTGIARLVIGTNGREMRVGSAWLRELNRDENAPEGTVFVSIYSAQDNMLYPQTSAELGKAKNIRILGLGHFSLILSRQVGQFVLKEIVNAERQTAAAA